MSPRGWIAAGALLAALSVVVGAFGAHGLPKFLQQRYDDAADVEARLANNETAARYNMYNAIGLILLGILAGIRPQRQASLQAAGWMLLGGTILFSGLLYLLVILPKQWSWLGMIVPIGGVMMIAGWCLIAIAQRGAVTEP